MAAGDLGAQIDTGIERPAEPCAPLARFCLATPEVGLADVGLYGRGASLVDLDSDGDEDLFVANADSPIRDGKVTRSQFFRNEGGGDLVSWDLDVDPEDLFLNWGATFADFDNDGDEEVLFSNGGYAGVARLAYYENDIAESGRLVPHTEDSGLNDEVANWWGASAADYDSDGWLDLVVAPRKGPVFLYHNDADGTFTDVTEDVGLADHTQGDGKNPVWIDYDADGDVDLYLAGVLSHALFRNDGVEGLVDVTEEVLGSDLPGRDFRTDVFAAAASDFDQDGHDDLFLGGWFAPSLVMHNNADGTMTPLGAEAGLDLAGAPQGQPDDRGYENTMGLGTGDLDADGYPDLLIGTGDPSTAAPNIVLCNKSGAGAGEGAVPIRFERCDLGVVSAIGPSRSHGAVLGDLNDDGAPDVVWSLGGDPVAEQTAAEAGIDPADVSEAPALLMQRPGSVGPTARIKLEGTISNRDAVGAKVRVDGDRTVWKTVRATQGFQSRNARTLVVPVPSTGGSGRVVVEWPSGIVQEATVTAGQKLELVEPEG